MKKIFFSLIALTLASLSVNAQVANTKWKGVLQLNNQVNVTFDFAKDTLKVINLDESSVLETMTYKATSSTLTFKKVTGQSECDNQTIGNYTYAIEGDHLTLTLVQDACSDRAVLNNLQLTKTPK